MCTGSENNVRDTCHHMLWERNQWNAEKLSKSVRNTAEFQIHLNQTVHRLLHAVIRPPRIPDTETLEQMRYYAPLGLTVVMNTIEHPIIEHFDRQLTVASVSPEVAQELLVTGRFIYG